MMVTFAPYSPLWTMCLLGHKRAIIEKNGESDTSLILSPIHQTPSLPHQYLHWIPCTVPTSSPPPNTTHISLPDTSKVTAKPNISIIVSGCSGELAWLSLFTAITALILLFQASNVCMLETSSGRWIVLELSVVL